MTAESLISPCDGLLSVYEIDEHNWIPAKYSRYRIEDLLENRELACTYRGGWCMVFRLRPSDYHRYCYIDNGYVKSRKGYQEYCTVYAQLPRKSIRFM